MRILQNAAVGVLLVAGCVKPSVEPSAVDAAATSKQEPAAEAEGACREHAQAWTSPGCCGSTDGLSPTAVVEACGFSEYLGQAQDWGCAHSFRAGDQTHLMRVTGVAPLSLTQALARHRTGFGPDTPATELGEVAGLPGSEATAYDGWAWAFVPRGDASLRLAWPHAACSLEALTPVLQAMSRSTPSQATDRSIASIAAGAKARADGAVAGSLLASFADRPPLEDTELEAFVLPYKAKRMHIVLIIATLQEDHASLAKFFTPHARYGLPDRRELGAKAVFAGDGGLEFMSRLRPVLQRFPADAPWTARPMPPEALKKVEDGSAAMWVWYEHAGETLVLRLIGPSGGAKIDYVGFWPDGPIASLVTAGEPPPPPIGPRADPP